MKNKENQPVAAEDIDSHVSTKLEYMPPVLIDYGTIERTTGQNTNSKKKPGKKKKNR